MRLTRRDVFRLMGGGTAAALFSPLMHHVWAAEKMGQAKRFVFFIEGNGLFPNLFRDPETLNNLKKSNGGKPISSYRDYGHGAPVVTPGAPLAQAPALGSLSGAGGRLDLTPRAAVVLGLSSTVAGGGHTAFHGGLSCSQSSGGLPGGESIDHHLASFMGAGTPFDVVRLGVGSPTLKLDYSLCAVAKKRAAPMIMNPSLAFDSLFSSVVGLGVDNPKFKKKKEMLDFAAADIRRVLGSFSGGAREREKMVQYQKAVEAMVLRHDDITNRSGTGDRLDKARQKYVSPPDQSALYGSTYHWDRLQAQVDIATAALVGHLTDVVVISCGAGSQWNLNYPDLHSLAGGVDLKDSHNDLRHGAGPGLDMNNPQFRVLQAATERQIGLMAKMARTLDEVPDAQGTMLENTVLVYMSDNGEQHHSKAEEWPFLLIGGSNLGVKTDGRSIVYPKAGHANNRQVSNLWNTLGQVSGESSLSEFGAEGPLRIAQGPLGSELFGRG